jgi:hypothetical protein
MSRCGQRRKDEASGTAEPAQFIEHRACLWWHRAGGLEPTAPLEI